MKYFLIAVKTENRIPYGLNANRAVDVRYNCPAVLEKNELVRWIKKYEHDN